MRLYLREILVKVSIPTPGIPEYVPLVSTLVEEMVPQMKSLMA